MKVEIINRETLKKDLKMYGKDALIAAGCVGLSIAEVANGASYFWFPLVVNTAAFAISTGFAISRKRSLDEYNALSEITNVEVYSLEPTHNNTISFSK